MSHAVIIATIVAYIVLLFIVARLASRGSSGATFFTGGRNTPRIVAAIAMVGAAMSGVTYISVPGTVAADSFSYLQTTLGFIVGYIIIAYALIPLYYRLGVVSLYEYLDQRFGIVAHRTGAWFFFISKILSASLRAYIICVVLQELLYDHYNIPFALNAAIMMTLVWLYTRRGGVRSVVWVETLKTIIMTTAIAVSIIYITKALNMNIGEAAEAIAESRYSEIWFMSNPLDRRYFWKQFIAGVFLVVAMTGLDQDMMQTILSCRDKRDAQRSMISSIVIQAVVIALFLSLGALLYIFADSRGIVVTQGDTLFGYVATECGLPVVVGILFLLGLVASTYSSAGSALTALTTSFTLDILGALHTPERVESLRKRSHIAIAMVMMAVIMLFGYCSAQGAITLIFTMASYTYGPLLGMFLFGLLCQRSVRSAAVPVIAIVAPIASYIIAQNSVAWFAGYQFSYEIIVVNALITILGLAAASSRR
ncbi:MAG: sodium:solute symporter [Alistipes sp.]|nr:sodium:solute symporter [Alistipes sp.]